MKNLAILNSNYKRFTFEYFLNLFYMYMYTCTGNSCNRPRYIKNMVLVLSLCYLFGRGGGEFLKR